MFVDARRCQVDAGIVMQALRFRFSGAQPSISCCWSKVLLVSSASAERCTKLILVHARCRHSPKELA